MKPFIVVSLLVFALGCTKSENADSTTGTPSNPNQLTTTPVNPDTKTSPADQKKDTTKDAPDQSDGPSKEPSHDKAPCCHGSALLFQVLDVEADLQGLTADLFPNKEYQADMTIKTNPEAVQENVLEVRASMPGMDHMMQYPAEKVSQGIYKINPILFTMKGVWEIAFVWITPEGEEIDACKCVKEVK